MLLLYYQIRIKTIRFAKFYCFIKDLKNLDKKREERVIYLFSIALLLKLLCIFLDGEKYNDFLFLHKIKPHCFKRFVMKYIVEPFG